MQSTIPHLQSAIRAALDKGEVCRIYEQSLIACWPNVSADDRADKIRRFAELNHWSVSIRQIGHSGLAAEFQKLRAPGQS